MVIRHVGVASLAKMLAALYALWGFIFGCFFALIALAGTGMGAATGEDVPGWLGGFLGVGAVIFLPIIYGIFGAIGGAITAVMYNIIAGMVGGLEISE